MYFCIIKLTILKVTTMEANLNLVEIFSEGEEQCFDQKCRFGNRVESHAVYCHCDNKDAPRKCRKEWYTGGKEKDEECEFFEINVNYKGSN